MSIADLQLSHCRSCGASIYWLKNDTTGRPAPIDARPDSSGPVIITVEGKQLRYHVLHADELAAGVEVSRYQPHYATCPQAEVWRSKGGSPTQERSR